MWYWIVWGTTKSHAQQSLSITLPGGASVRILVPAVCLLRQPPKQSLAFLKKVLRCFFNVTVLASLVLGPCLTASVKRKGTLILLSYNQSV